MIHWRRFIALAAATVLLVAADGCTRDGQPGAGAGRCTAAAAPQQQAAAEDDRARVKAAGKLMVGTSGDYAPFEFYNSAYQLDGFDIALMKEMGKRLGVEVEFNDFAFSGLLDALRLGQVDAAIGAISVTPDRQQLVDFTNLYYIGQDAALVRNDFAGGVNSATDLAGHKIGVERGTTYQAWAQQSLVDKGVIAQEDLVPYDGVTALTRDLRNGKVDVALMGLHPAQQQEIIFKDRQDRRPWYQQAAVRHRRPQWLDVDR